MTRVEFTSIFSLRGRVITCLSTGVPTARITFQRNRQLDWTPFAGDARKSPSSRARVGPPPEAALYAGLPEGLQAEGHDCRPAIDLRSWKK
jgi:hypothetical protein